MSEPQTPFIGQDGQPSPAPACDDRDRIIMELRASEARLASTLDLLLSLHIAHHNHPVHADARAAIAAAKGTAS